MRIAIAIGGNALIRAGEAGTWEEQLRNAREIARGDRRAARGGPRGRADPRQRPAGRRADAPAGARRGGGAAAAARRADRDDAGPDRLPARRRRSRRSTRRCRPRRCSRARWSTRATRRSRTPTKPVGPFYDDDEAQRLARGGAAWDVAPDAGRGWRRVVVPARGRVEVLGADHVARAARARRGRDRGRRRRDPGRARRGPAVDGVPGVIDKDRCSAELALAVGADMLVLLTGVPRVAIDFGTRWERELSRITVSDATRAPGRGRVPGRQHGPEDRVGGALRRGGRRARGDHRGRRTCWRPSAGADGTWIVPDERRVGARSDELGGARACATATSTACG